MKSEQFKRFAGGAMACSLRLNILAHSDTVCQDIHLMVDKTKATCARMPGGQFPPGHLSNKCHKSHLALPFLLIVLKNTDIRRRNFTSTIIQCSLLSPLTVGSAQPVFCCDYCPARFLFVVLHINAIR